MSALERAVEPELFTLPLPTPNSEEWYEMRGPYLGASDVACLFGVDPYRSIESLIAEKRTGEQREETRAMLLGKRMEDAIATFWGDEMGVTLEMPTVAYGRGRLLANPDRLIVGSHSDHVEVKRMVGKTVDRPTSGHWMQCQAQMACVGTERCWLVVEDSDDIKAFTIHRDDEFIAEVDGAVEMFWTMLEDGVDPPAMRRSERTETLALAEAEREVVANWIALKKIADGAAEAAKGMRTEVEAILGVGGLTPGSKLVVLGDDGPLVKVSMRRGRKGLDQKALKAEHPDLYDEFLTEGEPFPVMEVSR